ncbi:hypothetical protein Thiowin_01141 [Thiorhodovibrio winogradskyi]|uniref:Uncharacterized protein n=1 Tax=Thiorhodovibrio winogradskyi TaxID=77007 RepID=A0ABZ0S6F4_9GAMM|nr:hypothetical protein [Thiorhodovibrio winogradskyi]
MLFAQNTAAASLSEPNLLAGLREGLEPPSQWRATRLLRPTSLRLIKGGRPLEEALPELLSELQNANRTRIGAAQRLQETESLGTLLWSEAGMLLEQQARDRRGLPERPAQASRLDQLKACIAELVKAYQLALADAYAAPEARDSQASLCLSALRILEWTWRELELHHLRFQPLPGASWQRVNRIFFALLARATPDDPQPASTAPDFLADTEGHTTRARLYLNLQLQGLFDPFSWPKTTQSFIARYCALVPDAAQLQATLAPGPCQRFIHANLSGPPQTSPVAADSSSLTLDYSGLAEAIRADHQAFFRRDPAGTRTPERLRGLPPAARRPSIRLLARDMDNDAPEQSPEQPLSAPETLYLSAGMTTIRALLHQVFSRFPHSTSPGTQPRTRRDPLHQPSNLRTDGDPWQLVHQSARLWRVQNPSVQSSTALSVGTLVAFGGGQSGMARPRIGRVARILRGAGILQIDVQELACFAVPASVQAVTTALTEAHSSQTMVSGALPSMSKPFLHTHSDSKDKQLPGLTEESSTASPHRKETGEQSLRALLIYDQDFGWGLLTPPQPPLHEGDAIAIRTGRHEISSRLRSIRDASQDFLLFQINPNDPRLGVPSYPRAHKARRRAAAQRLTASPLDAHIQSDSSPRPPAV